MTEATTVNSNKRGLKWLAASVVLAMAGTVAVSAWADRGAGGHGGHRMGSHGMFLGSPEHMARGIDRLLDGVDATDAQRTQIKAIVQQAAADLKGQRDAGRTLRDQAMQLFTAPAVDAAAAESLRQQMLAQHDTASRRTLQAMLEISGVLTPEQRATLAEKMKQRQAHMHKRMQERMESRQPKQ